MNAEIKKLKEQADAARFLYNKGEITRDECKEQVTPFIKAFNKRSKEIAKKYNQKPKTMDFISYIR